MSRGGRTEVAAVTRAVGWIATLRVPPEEREYVLGDLAEGYATRYQQQGPWRARFW